MLDSDAPKALSVLQWLEEPGPFKLRSFEPKGGGGVFEALSVCLVTQ